MSACCCCWSGCPRGVYLTARLPPPPELLLLSMRCCCCCCWMLVVDDPTTGRRYLPSEKTPRRLLPLPPPALADIGDVDDMSLHSWRQSTPSSGRALALCSHSGCPAGQKNGFSDFLVSFFSFIIRLNSEIFNFGGNFKSGNLLVDCCCDPAGGRHHCTESNGLENIATSVTLCRHWRMLLVVRHSTRSTRNANGSLD